jgi:hypothetical protein
MAEIVVNKGELKAIKDGIDKLLKLGKENVRHTQYASDEPRELTEREKKILTYVKNNPGTLKENVIKYMEKEGICSRMTTVNAIDDLVEERMLIVRRDDSNQHIQHLYFNHEHIMNALLDDFDFFKQVYFRLIDETTKILKKLDQKKTQFPEKYLEIWELFSMLLLPYKHLIVIYFMFDLLLREEQPLDKNILLSRFTIVYDNMKEIHAKLHEYITPIITNLVDRDLNSQPLNSSLYDVEGTLSYESIKKFLFNYKMCGLSAFAEPVLDILWKISYPVLPNIDPVYAYGDRKILKDWRNTISEDKDITYKPKTTQAQNLGKRVIK